MTSRDTILQRVREGLRQAPQLAPPAVPEVWPRKAPTAAAMAERFTTELVAVQGEVSLCATVEDGRRQLAELVRRCPMDGAGRDGPCHNPRRYGRLTAGRNTLGCRLVGPRLSAQASRLQESQTEVLPRRLHRNI